MLMHTFGGENKVCYGRCALANECIPRDVQLLGNMLIGDVELWGVEEATPLTIVLKDDSNRTQKRQEVKRQVFLPQSHKFGFLLKSTFHPHL